MGPHGRERTAWSGWRRRASVPATGLLLLVSTTACTRDEIETAKSFGLPPPASDEAPDMGALWVGSWIAALAVGVVVWGLILWSVARYRRRGEDDLPIQTRYNLPIEVLYTVVPIIIIAVLFFFTIETQNTVLKNDALQKNVTKTEHVVLVIGQKWSWTFNYLDEPSLGGDTDVYDVGTPAEPPTLWLPVDESVRFELRSPDVIHSFFVPAFYYKMDVIPGRTNSFTLTPTNEGEYRGRCYELCGTYHSRMLFNVRIVSRDQFERHLAALERAGQVGAVTGDLDPANVPAYGSATPQEAQR